MYYENYLYHHGVKGQKWGVRRYQNKDGSLTPEGKSRLRSIDSELRELRGYERNPSTCAAKSKVSSYIRRNQINALEQERAEVTGLARRQRDAVKREHRAERLNAKALQTDNYRKIQELYNANADAAGSVREHSGIKKYIEPNVAVKNILAAGDAKKNMNVDEKAQVNT